MTSCEESSGGDYWAKFGRFSRRCVGKLAVEYWERHKWDHYHLPMFDGPDAVPPTEEEQRELEQFEKDWNEAVAE